MQALFGIRADLATYGKVVGGGMPIGILAGKSRVHGCARRRDVAVRRRFLPRSGVTFFAGTFVRHPLALAAVWAVLNICKEQGRGLQERLDARDRSGWWTQLNADFEARGVPTRIETFRQSVSTSRFPPEERFGSLLYYHLRNGHLTSRKASPAS